MTYLARTQALATTAPGCQDRYVAVIYIKRTSYRRMAETKRPGEQLAEILKERKISTTKFGEDAGGDYQIARRWIRGVGFDRNPRNQRRAAKLLKLPTNFFAQFGVVEDAQRKAQTIFEKFRATELGQSMTEDEQAMLASVRFFGRNRPTVAYYQGHLGLLRNQFPESAVEEVIRINNAADQEIQGKEKPDSTRPRRKKRDT
jgi:hypothetical protein